VRHFLDVVDPRSLFATKAQVDQACSLLDDYKRNKAAASATDAELWKALKLKQAVIHPATDEPIFLPLRMAAFIPANVPIIAGMLSATSPAATAAWQVINASYNSGLNYANRSGAVVASDQIAKSYALAVSTALGISFGVQRLGARGPLVFRKLVSKVPFVVPYCAVAGAGAANVYASRSTEISEGVPVSLENGDKVGTSRRAGAQGVYKTILTRAVGLPLPVLVLPPIIMAALPVPPQARLATELAVITMCLAGALPLTIAMFPPRLALDVDSLEPEYQNLTDPATGLPVRVLYANKGL
jgi:tricarboxylate carrier